MDDMEQLARGMASAPDEEGRLELAVQACLELVDGCDHAGITVTQRKEFASRATSDGVVEEADRLQYEFDEGPCLDAYRDQVVTLLSQDLSAEPRWPTWAPRVHRELGVSAVLSLLLFTEETSYGALNLYGDRRRGFDFHDVAVAEAVATHLGVSMAAGREIDQLETAVVNRTVIGQAEGILMERLGVDADAAFAFLSRSSQHLNQKLVHVAAEIVRTRELPGR